MFAVIYRVYLLPGKEQEYQQLWYQVATYFKQYRGALGSCLHKGNDGLWVSYSRWPDKATRDASWPGDDAPNDVLPEAIKLAIIKLQSYADKTRSEPEICLEIINDLLIPNTKTNSHEEFI